MENDLQTSRHLQKQKTRTAILSVAAELFKQKGFAKTTLRDVATNSGVATGTVFTHFEDKLDLLTHILFEELDSCVADAWKSLRRKKKDTKLLTQLTFLVRRVFTFYFSDPELSRVLLNEGIFSPRSGTRSTMSRRFTATFDGALMPSRIRFPLTTLIEKRYLIVFVIRRSEASTDGSQCSSQNQFSLVTRYC